MKGFVRVSIGQNTKVHINTKPQIIKIFLQSSEIKQTIYLLLRDKKNFSSISNVLEEKKCSQFSFPNICLSKFVICCCPLQTYKDSSKVIPPLLRIRNHKLEPIFCQMKMIPGEKKKKVKSLSGLCIQGLK